MGIAPASQTEKHTHLVLDSLLPIENYWTFANSSNFSEHFSCISDSQPHGHILEEMPGANPKRTLLLLESLKYVKIQYKPPEVQTPNQLYLLQTWASFSLRAIWLFFRPVHASSTNRCLSTGTANVHGRFEGRGVGHLDGLWFSGWLKTASIFLPIKRFAL